MKLKISNNLHIIDGNIVSYSTVVGKVTSTAILANGKYSRSTTKHVNSIAQAMGLTIKYVTMQQQWFSWYEYGANCKIDGALSPEGSAAILSKMRETDSDLRAAAIRALPELGSRDRAKCVTQLEASGIDQSVIDDALVLIELGLV